MPCARAFSITFAAVIALFSGQVFADTINVIASFPQELTEAY